MASPPARSRPHFLGTPGEGRAGAAAEQGAPAAGRDPGPVEGPTSQGSGWEGGLRCSRLQVRGRGGRQQKWVSVCFLAAQNIRIWSRDSQARLTPGVPCKGRFVLPPSLAG